MLAIAGFRTTVDLLTCHSAAHDESDPLMLLVTAAIPHKGVDASA